ncbi:MAG: dUTP diphosphatase [Clostridia bacterium]|nr:dUTP diphosphatase [Clostridia bacterium]
MIDVFVEIIREGVKLPAYANPYDAGMDVCAAEDVVIKPGETVIIPTGLKFAIPEGYEIQVRPRSGISYKTPLRLSNSPGTIDAGYRNELGILMTNTSPEGTELDSRLFTCEDKGNNKGSYHIKKGERIAQLVLAEVPRMNLKVVPSVLEIGTNRGGGFGSTGIK